MNWQFTRTNTWITFDRDEPICMIVPSRLDALEAIQPTIRDLASNEALLQHHSAWRESCLAFTERLLRCDPEAVRQGWQRNYFRGTAPHAGAEKIPEAEGHRTKLIVRDFAET